MFLHNGLFSLLLSLLLFLFLNTPIANGEFLGHCDTFKFHQARLAACQNALAYVPINASMAKPHNGPTQNIGRWGNGRFILPLGTCSIKLDADLYWYRKLSTLRYGLDVRTS